MFFVCLSTAFILGASLAGAVLSYFFQSHPMEFAWQIWAILAFLSAGGLGASLFLFFREKEKKVKSPLHLELEKFQKECKTAIRGHLKASILFWIHFYRKEKVKTLEEAKKEIFQDLKREFSDVRWMESILEDLRQEITRYK
jgi:MFS family permease